MASGGHTAPRPKRMIRNDLRLLEAPQHRLQQDHEEEQDPGCHAGKLEVVGAASAHVGGHALQLVPAVGAGLQVTRVVRSHDQAVTFSDGEDGEESYNTCKNDGDHIWSQFAS